MNTLTAVAIALIIGLSAAAALLALRARRLRNALRAADDRVAVLEREAVDLRETTRRAQGASSAKSDFLASVSHEMRTPLHGILGMLQLATDSEPSMERRQQLQIAGNAAKSLLSTIEEILDFTRVDVRKLELEPLYFSLRELFTDTMKTLGVTAAQKGLEIAFSIAPGVPDSLWGDPLRLRQIVINLVGNAIKFTESGEVVLRCWAVVNGREVALHIEVRDTGMGIDAHKQSIIFDPFAQAASVDTGEYGGTGLGLSIVARLVEAMDGSIDFQSEIGKGSTFHAMVKLEYDTIDVAPPPWEPLLSGLRALIVEPSATTRGIISEVLTSHGMTAECYGNLADALQPSIREAFSCVIIDAATLASTPWIAPVPVVQIVSPVSTEIVPAITVTRPAGERELLEGIALALGLIERRMLVTLERRVEGDRPQSVLVVDDAPVNVEFAAEALRRLGHSVATASTGTEALRLLAARAFDVALIDVQMPEMDGYELTRRIRSIERGRRMRIIAVTGHTGDEEHQRCVDAGMDSVLTKPVTQNRLAAVLRGKSLEAAGDTILEAVGGNVKLLTRVRDAFVSQAPRLLDAMRDAIEHRNANELYRNAHTLKGAISNFGMGEALEAAIEIERAGREAGFERAAQILPRLEEGVRELQERMSAAVVAAGQG